MGAAQLRLYANRLLDRGSNINSLQAIASVEEARDELGASELHAQAQAPIQLRPTARSPVRVLLRACRPRQWSKNLLVLAAPCAAGVIEEPRIAAQVAGAFLVLCLISS